MTTFENGSGELFTASRIAGLGRVAGQRQPPEPPAAPRLDQRRGPVLAGHQRADVPPTSGRATVWTTSQVLSTSGTLSATNSMANSTSDTTRTSVRANAAGSSIRSARWLRHISATVA